MSKSSISWTLYYLVCTATGLTLGIIGAILWGIWYPLRSPTMSAEVPSPASLSQTSPVSPSPVTLLFTGDVMLGRSVNKRIYESADPTWPFQYVADKLRAADITYINLEGPLTENCPITDTGMKFCGDLGNVAGLVSSGVDVASLANNHATNYGPTGLSSTISVLEANNIQPVGLRSPVEIVRQGQKFIFLSFNDIGPYPGIVNVDESTLSQQITQAKAEDSVLIVTFHWGHEYQSTPSTRQVKLAHQAIDAGADLVIGAHPHWIQTHEVYNGKPIYYSLGNFVFDQEWSVETKRGLVVEFAYLKGELLGTRELPVLIENYGQPRFN